MVILSAILVIAAAVEVARFQAPEARQGVAVGADHVYAVDNSTIAKYDKVTRAKLAEWKGDPARFPHINSCAVIGAELVCANSNYPQTPMRSSVEVFDPVTLAHLRSIPLDGAPGSLTWVDRRDGSWWAGFANYDGRGGEAGRDHRATVVVRFDAAWTPKQTWRYPDEVLARFAPSSNSGGIFGSDGLIYASGHDRPEIYALKADPASPTLSLVAILPAPIEGQAIAWDPVQPRIVWGISRANREVVSFRLPPVVP